MTQPPNTSTEGRRTPNPTLPVRVSRVLLALVAAFLALLAGLIVLGAYVPAVPKAGLAGPVLAGQWPFHLLGLALAALALGALTGRTGLVRTGRTLVAVTLVSCLATVGVIGTQTWAAARAGTGIAWGEVFTELFYPGVEPDVTETYAGEPLEVDVYLPAAAAGRATPAIVLAHAGGFNTFDKRDLRGTGRWLADHGVAAFAVDYRLASADTPTWDKAPQDLACALGWVGRHAERFSVDASRVSLGGMSAGGVLALNVAYRLKAGAIEPSCGERPTPPASAVGFYAGFDVAAQMWERDVCGSRRAAAWFTGGTPREVPERYREVSPVTWVRPGLMPTLLVTGDRDRCTPPDPNTAFAGALAAAGAGAQVEVLPFAVHAFDDAYGSLAAQTSRQILLDFLAGQNSSRRSVNRPTVRVRWSS